MHNKAMNWGIHFGRTLSHLEWIWTVLKSDRRDLVGSSKSSPYLPKASREGTMRTAPSSQLLVIVSSLTEQFQSHSASPIKDGSSHLSKAIRASHVKISPFVAWESRDERLLRPFTWVCFLLWDDYDITHHMCHLPTPGDCAGETQ